MLGLRIFHWGSALAILLVAAPALAQPRGLLPPIGGSSYSARQTPGAGSSRVSNRSTPSLRPGTVTPAARSPLGREPIGGDDHVEMEPPPSDVDAQHTMAGQSPLGRQAGLRSPLLTRSPTGWTSRSGLAFNRNAGSAGNRVQTVVAHANDTPNAESPWGVFDGGGRGAIEVVDEAWRRAQEGGAGVQVSQQRGNTVYTVDLGRRVGYVGGQPGAQRGNPLATRVRLVVSGRNELVTAYPVADDNARSRQSGPPSEASAPLQARPPTPAGNGPLGRSPLARAPSTPRQVGGAPRVVGALRFGRDASGRDRTQYVTAHGDDRPDSTAPWGVFEGGGEQAVGVVQEAWDRVQQGAEGVHESQSRGNRVFTVDLGRRVGYVGGQPGAARGNPAARFVRIVLRDNNEVVSAYPVETAGRGATEGSESAAPLAEAQPLQNANVGTSPLARASITQQRTQTAQTRTGAQLPLGTRAQYVAAHGNDRPEADAPWGVFDGGPEQAISTVHEAWQRAQQGGAGVRETTERGNRVVTVDLGRRVGFVGGRPGAERNHPEARFVRIVLRENNEVVSAYPVETDGSARGGGRGGGWGDPPMNLQRGVPPPQTPESRAALARWAATYRSTSGQAAQVAIYNRTHPPTPPADGDIARDLEQRLTQGEHPGLASVAPRATEHVRLGLPSSSDRSHPDDFLLVRNDQVISYNRDRRVPNWISWHLDREDMGTVERADNFREDPTLPRDWPRATIADYQGSGYHRGHMVRSGERTSSSRTNARTFVLTNILPQARNNNVGPWNGFENYYREQVATEDREVYVMAGPVFRGTPQRIGQNGVAVPVATWKVAVIVNRGQTLADVGPNTRVVSVIIPNSNRDVRMEEHWADFRVTPADIERATGLEFFTNLPANVAQSLRNQLDTQAIEYIPPEHH